MGKRLLLYILILFGTISAHAQNEVSINDIECIKAARSGPKGEFTHDQIRLTLQSIENYWRREFVARNLPFEEIRYVVFNGAIQTACGPVTIDNGPVYCFADQTVYIEPTWFRANRKILGQETQTLLTFALAHEFSHHIQQQLDVMPRIERLMQLQYGHGYTSGVDLGPPMEYQADCLAAVYLSTLHEMKLLSDSDLRESVKRMLVFGDDAADIRRQMQLHQKPWNLMLSSVRAGYSHGTSKERQKWFIIGLLGAKLEVCEPFLFPTL